MEKDHLYEQPFRAGSPAERERCQVRSKSKRGQVLDRLKSVVVMCGVLAFSTWATFGITNGYFNPSSSSTIGMGWVWGSGGDAFVLRKDWRFDDIIPSKDLNWKPCQGEFLCARLDVPLDYRNETDKRRAAIALVKLPAKIPQLPGKHQPSILLNPGGPGGSGVSLAFGAGAYIQVVVGLQYSIIGFDPRGVNNTTPRFDCFQSNPLARTLWTNEYSSMLLSTSTDSIAEAWALNYGAGKQCAEVTGGDESPGRHLSTPVVATDMLSIVEAEQREAGLKPKDGKLWYWGFSYGTILGMTFADMYPDRVGRVIVDGVVDGDDYYRNTWSHNLDNSEDVMDSFYKYCSEAGPEICVFHAGNSPDDIRQRMYRLMDNLKKRPLSVYKDTLTGKPEILTLANLKLLIFASLYSPIQAFPVVAQGCLEFENGNGENAIKIMRKVIKCDCHVEPGLKPWEAWEVRPAIYCSDANGTHYEYEEFRQYVDAQSAKSPTMGGIWSMIPLYCVGWDLLPAWPFDGDYEADTSHPLLFVGNTADPVTPLRNAHQMVKGYKDAVVLTQRSEGHCSISAPSLCSAYHVRRYFTFGKLPPLGTVCEVEFKPFLGRSKIANIKEVMSEEDLKLTEAMEAIAQNFFDFPY